MSAEANERAISPTLTLRRAQGDSPLLEACHLDQRERSIHVQFLIGV
jgi:hypothetical protein